MEFDELAQAVVRGLHRLSPLEGRSAAELPTGHLGPAQPGSGDFARPRRESPAAMTQSQDALTGYERLAVGAYLNDVWPIDV